MKVHASPHPSPHPPRPRPRPRLRPRGVCDGDASSRRGDRPRIAGASAEPRAPRSGQRRGGAVANRTSPRAGYLRAETHRAADRPRIRVHRVRSAPVLGPDAESRSARLRSSSNASTRAGHGASGNIFRSHASRLARWTSRAAGYGRASYRSSASAPMLARLVCSSAAARIMDFITVLCRSGSVLSRCCAYFSESSRRLFPRLTCRPCAPASISSRSRGVHHVGVSEQVLGHRLGHAVLLDAGATPRRLTPKTDSRGSTWVSD